jgi:hypothetical protein
VTSSYKKMNSCRSSFCWDWVGREKFGLGLNTLGSGFFRPGLLFSKIGLGLLLNKQKSRALTWHSGLHYRTKDPGFKSCQDVRFFGIYILQCWCHYLICIVIVCEWEKLMLKKSLHKKVRPKPRPFELGLGPGLHPSLVSRKKTARRNKMNFLPENVLISSERVP